MYTTEKERLKNSERFTVEDLRLIMKILRSDEGCPWDREQSHETIVSSLIEETYETVEAIEKKNADMLCEELGDVLLQVVFHTQMEEETGVFGFDDVVNGICRKMIVRHPHVFGSVCAKDSKTVLENWDAIKAKTKNTETLYDKLSSIAVTLPALQRCQKIVHKILKEKALPGISEADGMTENEVSLGKKLLDATLECEKAGVDAETVLRRYCGAITETIGKDSDKASE